MRNKDKKKFISSVESGFSLLEVLAITAIIVIISSLAAYQARKSVAQFNLNADAQQMATSFRLARMRAIGMDREVRFTFANGTYGISDAALTDNETRRRALPALSMTSSITPLPVIVFSQKGAVTFENADGTTAAQALTLTLTDPHGEAMRISLNKNGLTEVTPIHSQSPNE